MVTQAEQVTGLIPSHCSSCQNVIKQDNKSESSVVGVWCVCVRLLICYEKH